MQLRLHSGQLKVFQDKTKVRVLVAGRRYGKSTLMLWEAILASLQYPGEVDVTRPACVLLTEPTMPMSKKVLWTPLLGILEKTEVGKFVKNINKTDFRIDWELNKPSLYVSSALEDGGSRLRGMKLWYAGLDEFQNYRSTTFDQVLYPATTDTPGSRVLITGTPLGTSNILYEMFQRENKAPELYKSFTMHTADNPLISRKEIANSKLMLPPRAFRQEYEATFLQPAGQYYTELGEENLVQSKPANYDLVVMGFDFGDVNPCAVVLGRLNHVWYFLEGWQPCTGEPVPESVQEENILRLSRKYHPTMMLCDPSRPSAILGLRKLGKATSQIGLAKATAAFNRIDEGIAQVHELIFQRRFLFNDNDPEMADDGINGLIAYGYLGEYHRVVKPDGTIVDEPADGKFSHCCDAIRYALAVKTGTA